MAIRILWVELPRYHSGEYCLYVLYDSHMDDAWKRACIHCNTLWLSIAVIQSASYHRRAYPSACNISEGPWLVHLPMYLWYIVLNC